ncbi:MAG: hypothetical protein ACKPB3_00110 [Bacteroidota bacterium]
MPTVFFYQQGVFDEYDNWAGTVALVFFALAETVLFAWIFGMDKGWKEINRGGDIVIPTIFRFVIKWVTPFLLFFVFMGALIKPVDNDWVGAIQHGWVLDNSSIIKQITHAGIDAQIAASSDPAEIETLEEKKVFMNFARIMLILLFVFISVLVYIAYDKRKKEGRIH